MDLGPLIDHSSVAIQALTSLAMVVFAALAFKKKLLSRS